MGESMREVAPSRCSRGVRSRPMSESEWRNGSKYSKVSDDCRVGVERVDSWQMTVVAGEGLIDWVDEWMNDLSEWMNDWINGLTMDQWCRIRNSPDSGQFLKVLVWIASSVVVSVRINTKQSTTQINTCRRLYPPETPRLINETFSNDNNNNRLQLDPVADWTSRFQTVRSAKGEQRGKRRTRRKNRSWKGRRKRSQKLDNWCASDE